MAINNVPAVGDDQQWKKEVELELQAQRQILDAIKQVLGIK